MASKPTTSAIKRHFSAKTASTHKSIKKASPGPLSKQAAQSAGEAGKVRSAITTNL